MGDGERVVGRGVCAKKRLRALKKGYKKGAIVWYGAGASREGDKYLQNFFANKREENIANPKKSA